MEIITAFFAIIILVLVILLANKASSATRLKEKIKNQETTLLRLQNEVTTHRNTIDALAAKISTETKRADTYAQDLNAAAKRLNQEERRAEILQEKVERLSRYQRIIDVEKHIEQLNEQVQQTKLAAQAETDSLLSDAKNKAKNLRELADLRIEEAHALAQRVTQEANRKALEIAGDAWQAKMNADQYQATVQAMKNIINGYGDEYLVPNESLLDELADEYNHENAAQELKLIREQIKLMIKHGEAAACDYVEPHRRKTAIEFALDAFNGKVDTIMSKVKYDNYGMLKQQLVDAFHLVNHNGGAFKNARITSSYLDIMLQQLKVATTVLELKKRDLEEQRRIRDEMREEERARREYEKALKEAEKEERILAKAMIEAEAKLAVAVDEERALYEGQLAELMDKLKEAEARGQRALSMAQQTKQGHVYIISNIGSFGEHVFKIGLTRRLEPLDRVRELGDASVPFAFDVHAMIHSDDAPALERSLHTQFINAQVNKVNPRKEFFRLPLSEIKEHIQSLGLNTHWTMKAEALEYRESLQLEKRLHQQTLLRSSQPVEIS